MPEKVNTDDDRRCFSWMNILTFDKHEKLCLKSNIKALLINPPKYKQNHHNITFYFTEININIYYIKYFVNSGL